MTANQPTTDHAVETPHELLVTRTFIAQHYLTVPDPGPEGEVHSHRFGLEVCFAGPHLDEYGYLVDIDAVEAALDDIEARYGDALLNEQPAFEGLNPSIEHFARVIGDRLADTLDAPAATRLTVRVWEDDLARASHERILDS
jgi:6-pyruvoyltetrahydropterin/6-carboxytetrahydropterin synthase